MSYQYHKQPHLNGAYYGPPIPPPKSYHRPSNGGRGCCGRCGCCLFDCFYDCGCCLLGCVFKFICSILLVVAVIAVILWFLFRPHEVKFYASNASLSTFNYSGNQLSYNLAVNLSVRNPNNRVGVYYDVFEANAIYEGKRFSMVEVDPFFQESKNTTEIGPVAFKGQSAFSLGSDQNSDYESHKKNGEFEIVVKLHLKVRFKILLFKTGKFKPKFRCNLNVPLNGSSSAAAFHSTRCYFDP